MVAYGQDTSKVKYEYAFVYPDLAADSIKIVFDSEKTVNITNITYKNYIKEQTVLYGKIVEGFKLYTKAFNYLDAQGYEFMGTGSYIYNNSTMSYYIYRRKKS